MAVVLDFVLVAFFAMLVLAGFAFSAAVIIVGAHKTWEALWHRKAKR
jgi:hypothetical protein